MGTCLHVDSSVTTQYHQHIDSGHKLASPYQSVVAPRHTVNQPGFTISLSRSLSRLKQLYFVLVANADNATKVFKQRLGNLASVTTSQDVMSFQVQVGSQKFPDNECVGVGESFFRLLQASGHEKDKDDIATKPDDYVKETAIFASTSKRPATKRCFRALARATAR